MEEESAGRAGENGSVQKVRLDNGLQILLKESHLAPVASFWIYYRVGSRNEVPGVTGISHWVEHMLFKGTERYPQGAFDKAVARAGGAFNGMTWQDWTTYFETFPAERIELALDVESDRMANAIFDEEETESERTVIISEREGSENSYRWLLNTEMQAAAFQTHPYRHPVIGWKHDLLTMRRDDLYEHYRTFYTPSNAVAVVVGDFDSAQMTDRIEQYFGGLEAGPALPEMRFEEPEQRAERRIVLRGTDQTSYFGLAFHAPDARHPDFFALTVMDSILSGAKGMGLFGGGSSNRSNRLYRALVDKELAVGASSAFMPTIDPYVFGFSATLAQDITHQEIEEAIWAEIERMQEEPVAAEELEKAIKQTKAQFAYSSESVTNQAYWLGFSEMIADSEWFDGWLENLEAVTAEDIQRVAQSWFGRNKQTVGWYMPEA
ncbi:MAG: insulinase family protein [Caldilineaceae bacterium SB0675_bin_29]|uniref:Insulinase family protein n=1 Tax=Caldilineaceae bacterium SB0675_bin_29 TaxID=2605266 RepID=A0A6B1G4F0_9CHLR|nr:insulinase family protein [Caldilineaceae bacterium SB0675_bin_29]